MYNNVDNNTSRTTTTNIIIRTLNAWKCHSCHIISRI